MPTKTLKLWQWLPVAALALAGLACATFGGGGPDQPTDAVGNVATAAALTATALVTTPDVPTATPEAGAPPTTEEPTAEEPTAETPTEAPPATAAPAGPTCAIAYADFSLGADPAAPVHTGNLYCLDAGGAPVVLATGNQPSGPRISPDGTLIAFQLATATDGVSELWVVSAAGGDARLLVGTAALPSGGDTTINSPKSYQWLAGTHTLVFDTRYIPAGGPFGPGEYINSDLWTVNVDTGVVTALLPAGAAGAFAVSPNGQTVAIARPTGLDLVNADGGNYRQDVITFPAILTYSEYAYKPFIQWGADGTFFNVSIPSPDPMAADARADFYRVGVDGIVTPLTSQPINIVFGGMVTPPQYAPNGRFVVYSVSQPDGTGEVFHQLEFLADGTVADRSMGPTLFLSGGQWSPDSTYFQYAVTPLGAPGQGYVTGTTAESVQTFANGLAALWALEWQDGTTMVFIAKLGAADTWSLYRQTLGSEPVLLAGSLGEQVTLDVRQP
ncbi:MAG: PD40 domain-containing protein [Anaerolineales bacterium]|nr:PD40 domain-containing protein [Anaerolineales bacterium]